MQFTLIFEVKQNISQTGQAARKLLLDSLYHLEEIYLINEYVSDTKNSIRLSCQLESPSISLIKTLIGKMAPETVKTRLFINNYEQEYDVNVKVGE